MHELRQALPVSCCSFEIAESLIPIRRLTKLLTERVTEFVVLNPKRIKDRKHLRVQLPLGQSDAGMVAFVVLGAAVVNIIPFTALGHLCLSLARDRRTTVGTFNQIAGIRHLMLLVDLLAKESLNTIPELGFDERRVCAGMPLTSELDLTDVRAVGEDRIELAATDLGN